MPPPRPPIDVCLVLESTYPFRTGGVSTWTHALVEGLAGRTFAVAHLHAGEPPGPPAFPAPPNLAEVVPLRLPEPPTEAALAPLASAVPRARLYHALSTGYAGLVAARAAGRRTVPFVLTEHGIYSHEAALAGGEVECGRNVLRGAAGSAATGIARLEEYARAAYAAADAVVTLCEPNWRLQRALGAPPARARLIPNGVELPPRPLPPRPGPPAVGLVGRVVRLKDVETFLRACRRLQDRRPDAACYVVGPTDADPAYAAACRRLAARLGVRVTFTGHADAPAWYARLDVVALTSVSEAQPLVLLEAMAHGRPVVATDVGDCRALVLGAGDAFGPAGVLCRPGDATGIGDAFGALLADPVRARAAGRAGRRRVAAHYTRATFLDAYDALYVEHLPVPPG